jgi:hypothetical protein
MIELLIESFNDQLPKLPEAIVLLNGMAANNISFTPHLKRSNDGFFGLGRDEVATGSVAFVNRYLRNTDIKINYLDYPESLHSFLGRKIELTTMNTIGVYEDCFVKPFITKQFDGFCNMEKGKIAIWEKFPNEKCWKSNILKFAAEYRIFIHKKKIVGAKHYRGEFSLPFNQNTVEEMIEAFDDQPTAYSLDVGVVYGLTRTKTILVEVNDFPALGSYGLDPVIYTEAYLDRWAEILAKRHT